MPAIELRELVVRYGHRVAVDGITLSADKGHVLALLGPNGAGKTTTVETLEGYRKPSSGSVRVLGLDPLSQRRSVASRIGVMLQEGGVYARMTPRQSLHLFAGYYTRPENPDKLLEELGLSRASSTPWRRLSGGEKQRLSLGLALIGHPEVAFLDEPTSGVDPAGRLLVRGIVRRLADEGVCVLLTTHELEEAERVADDVAILDHGKVVARGTPSDLMSSSGGEVIRFGAPPRLDLASLQSSVGAVVREEQPGEYLVEAPPSPERVAAVTAWLAGNQVPLSDLRAGRASLEDVFLRLTKESEK